MELAKQNFLQWTSERLGRVGRRSALFLENQLYVSTMFCMGLVMAVQPGTWVYPVRNRLARQILFAGVEAIPFTILVAVFVGASVYLQCLFWLEYTSKVEFLGRMVAAIVFRELAPFLSTFIVIGASASAITTELANMKTSGEIRLLESQGVNVFQYIAVPRMIGLSICVFGLAVIFAMVAVVASGLGLTLFRTESRGAAPFLRSVFEAVNVIDWVSLAVKSLVPGLIMGAICCHEGLRVTGASTEVPQAVSRAILRSISYAVFISGIVMMITYLG